MPHAHPCVDRKNYAARPYAVGPYSHAVAFGTAVQGSSLAEQADAVFERYACHPASPKVGPTSLLPPDFVRCHRSCLVNPRHIRTLHAGSGSRYWLVLDDGGSCRWAAPTSTGCGANSGSNEGAAGPYCNRSRDLADCVQSSLASSRARRRRR